MSTQKQEPAAWIYKPNMELLWPDEIEVKDPSKHRDYKPLYTSPQPSQRSVKPWAGLTQEDWMELKCKTHGEVRIGLDVAAKLREKNEHGEKNT